MTGTKTGLSPFRTHLKARLDTNTKSFVPVLILQLLGFPQIAATSLYISGFFQEERIKKDKIEDMIDLNLSTICTVSVMVALFSMAVLIILAVSGGFSAFRYLHRKPETDEIFSLPVTKKQLFAADYLSGLSVHLIPGLAAALLSALLLWITPGHKLWASRYSAIDLANLILAGGRSWSSSILSVTTDFSAFMSSASDFVITIVMVYTFAVLSSVCCGKRQEAVSYFLVSGISLTSFAALFKIITEQSILNNATAYFVFSDAELFSPFGGIIRLIRNSCFTSSDSYLFRMVSYYIGESIPPDSHTDWPVWHLFFAAVYLFAAYTVFLKRKAEDTSEPFAFPVFFYASSFLVTGTIVFMLAAISIRNVYSYEFALSLAVSLIISAVIFLIMQLIKNRGIKIKKSGKQAVFFLCSFNICAAAIFLSRATYGFGMMYYVPAPEKVSSVLIYADGEGGCEYNDYDTIKAITELHSEINEETKTWTINGTSHIDEAVENGSLVNRKYKLTAHSAKIPGTYVINYLMKNGKSIARVVIPVNTDITDTPFFGVYNEIRSRSVNIPTDIISQIAGSDAVFCGDTAYADELCEPRFSWFTSGAVHYPAEYRLTDFENDILRELLSHAYTAWYISPDSCYVLYTETSPQFFIPKEYGNLYNSLLKSASKEKLDWEWFPDN